MERMSGGTRPGMACLCLPRTLLPYEQRSRQFSMIPTSPDGSPRMHRNACENDSTLMSKPTGWRSYIVTY
jgi:hypothetical protein